MVEREAQVARERPLVAAVIYNRLKAGQPLGIDATIRYATGNWSEPLKQSELAIDSAYNTRTRAGLPPGPIGNPGLASLQAAARPARVGYLFYVVKPGTCGEHAFSSTDAQFEQDQQRYNEARDAAGGKRPRPADERTPRSRVRMRRQEQPQPRMTARRPAGPARRAQPLAGHAQRRLPRAGPRLAL